MLWGDLHTIYTSDRGGRRHTKKLQIYEDASVNPPMHLLTADDWMKQKDQQRGAISSQQSRPIISIMQ